MKKALLLPIAIIFFGVLIFFKPIFEGKLPVPSDTIVGLYYPYRDFYSQQFPRGVPFKNSLVTDPVRQQYPWRIFSVDSLKRLILPSWNPYSMSGVPHLANMQSAALYPFNILFFIIPFSFSWTILIMLQPFLAAFFLYLYLTEIRISKTSALFGAFIFAFCGFSVAWLTWGTIIHTALWLPFILYIKEKLLKRISLNWILLLIFAECAQLFAGHLQTWFYSLVVSNVYLLARLLQTTPAKEKFIYSVLKRYKPFFCVGIVVFLLSSIQLIPTIKYILLSARDVDQFAWQREGWFIPWQHLVQFIAPDFFGNPTTQNYWGVWNYGEFIGYIGVLPFIFALYALFFRHDRKTFFFGVLFFLSLILALPFSYISEIPYLLKIPFLSTAQPTRLLFIVDFSLAILAAFGFDYYLRSKKGIYFPLSVFGFFLGILWAFVLLKFPVIFEKDLLVARNNLIFPSILFLGAIITLYFRTTQLYKKIPYIFIGAVFIFTVFDLVRFAIKFTPFSSTSYLYPQTKTLAYLSNHAGYSRIMTTDSRLLPPNFSIMHKLQSVDGYDPLYLRRYAELIAASERGMPDISPPFGFNRIITPHKYDSKIMDLLNVKYVLSLEELESEKLKKVFQEGQTRLYENTAVLPRAFFVEEITQIIGEDKQKTIKKMFDTDLDFEKTAIVEGLPSTGGLLPTTYKKGRVKILDYQPTNIRLAVEIESNGFLVLMDAFYPTWEAILINENTNQKTKVKIYRTNYNYRGVPVPKGINIVEFHNTLL